MKNSDNYEKEITQDIELEVPEKKERYKKRKSQIIKAMNIGKKLKENIQNQENMMLQRKKNHITF